MIQNNRKKYFATASAICFIMTLVANTGQVYASPPENALKKFEAYGLYSCMQDQFKRSFTQEEVEEDFFNNTTDSLMKGGDSDSVSLPAGSDLRGANNDKVNCAKLTADLIGANSFNENPYGSFVELLEKFGYNKQGATSGGSKCKIYKFKATQYSEGSWLYGKWHDAGAIEYCESSVNSNGTINNDSKPTYKVLYGNYSDQAIKSFYSDGGPYMGYLYRGDSSKITYCYNYQKSWYAGDDCSGYDDEDKVSVSRSGSWETVSGNLGKGIEDFFKTNSEEDDALLEDLTNGIYIKYAGPIDGTSNSSTADSAFEYKITNVLQSFKKAYKNIWGEDFSSYKFDKSQQAGLYQNYILSYWEAETEACADTKIASEEAGKDLVMGNNTDSYYHQTKLYKSDGAAQYCYVKTEKWGNQVYGINNDQLPSNDKIGFAAVAKWLLDNGPDSIDPEDMATSTTSNTDSTNGEVEPTCMNRAGTSLGWILCPVLDAFGGATDWAYNELVEPALEIEPQLFTGEGDNTRDAWKTFRDIANIFFIILFLVVIFSQLTGVGIDNYGIKKILPKLIVAAVLINLSYIICVVFIDLSNILGNGLRNIFTRLGSQLTIPDSIEGIKIGDVAGGALTAITVLIALVGGVAVAITAAGGVVAFLVSLLVVALSAIIALFFLFLLLAAREAAIVVLTVLSPLAFACYILPNTQNIFKKWYQLGWRLLMVYPIAGLLIGGGDYVSKLLLSAGAGEGFFSAFTAMIAGIVPIFFIPTVLKQSFALMGGLGAKIAGFGKSMGSRVSGNLDKSVRGGERFKNYQADRERNRKLRYARRTNRNLSDRLDNGETLSQRQRDRLARARMVESAEYSDELKRRAIVDGNRYETMRAGIEAKSRDEAINDRLALMQKNGVNGGAYSLENMYARMQNLEKASRTQALTDDEKGEMAALARGMASRQGGASMLNSIIRSAGSDGKSNSNFMSAMGEIYGNDSAVASKMAEKDAGASAFTEKFMPNGAGYDGDFAAYQGTKEYKDAIDKRIKSYSAGLNQGGAAVTDYVNSLDKSDLQAIIDNEGLYNSLDTDVRRAIDERTGSGPKGLNIQRTARQVEIAGENQVFDVHGLDSDTLLDIATNPKISDNDPNRAAAVEELNKRGIK